MSDSSQPQSLYAARIPIFPRRVSGFFRNLKWWIMGITLGIYYLTPWLRWDRGADMPDQAVLVDLANRRFYFFFVEIWPHEFYFVAGLLIMAGLGLFVFTSALGRVWCGYACPQTVWTDLFILVERWIEGDRNARVRLHTAPWSLRKARLRLTKWTTWLLISVATGGAWIFYFTDAPTLLRNLVTLQAPMIAWSTIGILTATTFIFGGFMREQVCIYMCPWPRIQSAMVDDSTLTVAYRGWRGEPRGKHRKSAEAEALGDCVDCMACVNVCPMGIDIRNGQQMECITCALCIDACDDVMAKLGKPRGLVDYLALNETVPATEAEKATWTPPSALRQIFRLRVMVYTGIWALFGVALLVGLWLRPALEMTVSPVRNPVYVTLSDGTVRNVYDVRIRNKHLATRLYRLSHDGDSALRVGVQGAEDATVLVPADTQMLVRVYLSAPGGSPIAVAERTDVTLRVTDTDDGDSAAVATTFNGTGAGQ